MKRISLGIIAVAVALTIAMLLVSAFKPQAFTTLVFALWQLISLAVGLFGSYLFGRHAARQAAHFAIRPHARSALRKTLVLYRGIRRLSTAVERLHPRESVEPDARFGLLQLLIDDQANVARAAIADWRDVIPDDFEDVVKTLDLPEDLRRE